MNDLAFSFVQQNLRALGSGALWWPDQNLLCVSDLHLGKSERMARRGGPSLPPYDSLDTLTRLAADIEKTEAQTVICLGDSFDDLDALAALGTAEKLRLTALQAGRQWIWIEGNHDPGPIDLGGTHRSDCLAGPLVFRHIAQPGGRGEVSGHFHPKIRLKARGRSITRPAFLLDHARLILPAYGTYTGGLLSSEKVLNELMSDRAMAILTGQQPQLIPMPR
ncbi:ligase-associated DNA damage response endonuclease PdeM [Ruegeria sp. Ofav3-42]|uniref:ligase-associated DNA damage response endonuclease PdeM n=1 Tax=Ruegeria sp. Ofav3-42 TaxID=2917759 RepID=UPI001EF6E412|nr:ligase-associated DNA damage response endonuclease PdeM [Ruegeria sp. Ofav3-42]MCG7518718.1 ligase-associated DNA damage response endonuclease PdeM [Ruegeria sp. Ofav3-42]